MIRRAALVAAALCAACVKEDHKSSALEERKPAATSSASPSERPPPPPIAASNAPVTTTHPGAPPLPTAALSESPISGQPALAWLSSVPLPGIEAMGFAGDGTLIVAAGCTGAGTFGDKKLACATSEPPELNVARFDRKGAATWVTKLVRYRYRDVSLAVDARGETVLATGERKADGGETVITRIAHDGTPRWTTRIPGIWPQLHRVAVNADGHVAVIQWSAERRADERLILTKLSADGRAQWLTTVRPFGGNGETVADGLAMDVEGRIAVLQRSGSRKEEQLTNEKRGLTVYSPNGAELWSSKELAQADFLVDPAAGGGFLVSSGVPRPLILRFSGDGKAMPGVSIETTDYFTDVAPDTAGGLIGFTRFGPGTMKIGDKSFTSTANEDLLLARFDAAMVPLWIVHYPGPGHEYSRGLAVSRGGRIAIAGSIEKTLQIEGRTIKNETGKDLGAFLGVFGP